MATKRRRKQESLPVQWEDLTLSDFPKAVKRARGVCVLPIGVIEPHGPHLPLSTDMMGAREASIRAAQKEYAVVFPQYYFGQVHCAKHWPGAIALRPELLDALLQEVCDEIARNGFEKILLVNGHGGETHRLHYFCQAQLAKRSDYVVYLYRRSLDPESEQKIAAMRKTKHGGHADEVESSCIMAIRPDLVHLDRAASIDGRAKGRLKHIGGAFTGIWWYADYPDHYAGDAQPANAELGELVLKPRSDDLAKLIREVKQDKVTPKLQEEFFGRMEAPTAETARKKRR